MSGQAKQNILEKVPTNRLSSTIDITEAVRLLAHQAQYFTGQILTLDGSRTVSQHPHSWCNGSSEVPQNLQ